MRARLILCLLLGLLVASAARAERTISADAFRDRLAGMWLGQLLGNYAGRQVEGLEIVYREGPNAVNKPITAYQVQWDAILQGRYHGGNGNLYGDPGRWLADDDTCLEFAYAYALQYQAGLDVQQRTTLWQTNLSSFGLYFGNLEAHRLINIHGRTAAESGQARYNLYANWTIDGQITTEILGALAAGMRQRAAELAGDFGGITNYGFSLHAAQFYAAMYAEAPFAADVGTLVGKGLAAVPIGSWARAIIEEARGLYQADLAANGLADGWLASRNAVLAFVQQRGRGRVWVQSASNLGLTTLAVLYGQGDFKLTVEYGVRGGHDSDCNPATAGGLIGMMKGWTGLSAGLTAAGLNTAALPPVYYDSPTVFGLPQTDWTMAEVLDIFQQAAEMQILAGGGAITGSGAARQYQLPSAETGSDAVHTGNVSDPDGPRGLVRQVLDAGGQVSVVVTRNGAIMPDEPAMDPHDQARLIDGVSDLRHNGVLPFETYDGSTAPRVDGYEVHFDRDAMIQSLIVHEGVIGPCGWGVADWKDPNTPPYGGFFTTVAVEVLRDAAWVPVSSLVLSEALDPTIYFQSIELTFEPMAGRAVRVVGPAGGTRPYTAITEIEVFGAPAGGPADFDGDGRVTGADFMIWQNHYPTASGATRAQGDANGDGTVSGADFIIWQAYYVP